MVSAALTLVRGARSAPPGSESRESRTPSAPHPPITTPMEALVTRVEVRPTFADVLVTARCSDTVCFMGCGQMDLRTGAIQDWQAQGAHLNLVGSDGATRSAIPDRQSYVLVDRGHTGGAVQTGAMGWQPQLVQQRMDVACADSDAHSQHQGLERQALATYPPPGRTSASDPPRTGWHPEVKPSPSPPPRKHPNFHDHAVAPPNLAAARPQAAPTPPPCPHDAPSYSPWPVPHDRAQPAYPSEAQPPHGTHGSYQAEHEAVGALTAGLMAAVASSTPALTQQLLQGDPKASRAAPRMAMEKAGRRVVATSRPKPQNPAPPKPAAPGPRKPKARPPFCSVTGTGVAETPPLPKFRRKRPKQRMPRTAPGDGTPHPAPPATPASAQSQPRGPKNLERGQRPPSRGRHGSQSQGRVARVHAALMDSRNVTLGHPQITGPLPLSPGSVDPSDTLDEGDSSFSSAVHVDSLLRMSPHDGAEGYASATSPGAASLNSLRAFLQGAQAAAISPFATSPPAARPQQRQLEQQLLHLTDLQQRGRGPQPGDGRPPATSPTYAPQPPPAAVVAGYAGGARAWLAHSPVARVVVTPGRARAARYEAWSEAETKLADAEQAPASHFVPQAREHCEGPGASLEEPEDQPDVLAHACDSSCLEGGAPLPQPERQLDPLDQRQEFLHADPRADMRRDSQQSGSPGTPLLQRFLEADADVERDSLQGPQLDPDAAWDHRARPNADPGSQPVPDLHAQEHAQQQPDRQADADRHPDARQDTRQDMQAQPAPPLALQSDMQPELQPDARPDAPADPQPQPLAHTQTDKEPHNVDTLPDTKSDTPLDTKSDTPPDTKSDTPPDTKSDTPPDTKSDTPPDTKPDTPPDTHSDAQADEHPPTHPAKQPEMPADTQPGARADDLGETEPDTQSDKRDDRDMADTSVSSQTGAQVEAPAKAAAKAPAEDADADAGTQADAEADAQVQAQAATHIEAPAETQSDVQGNARSDAHQDTQAHAQTHTPTETRAETLPSHPSDAEPNRPLEAKPDPRLEAQPEEERETQWGPAALTAASAARDASPDPQPDLTATVAAESCRVTESPPPSPPPSGDRRPEPSAHSAPQAPRAPPDAEPQAASDAETGAEAQARAPPATPGSPGAGCVAAPVEAQARAPPSTPGSPGADCVAAPAEGPPALPPVRVRVTVLQTQGPVPRDTELCVRVRLGPCGDVTGEDDLDMANPFWNEDFTFDLVDRADPAADRLRLELLTFPHEARLAEAALDLRALALGNTHDVAPRLQWDGAAPAGDCHLNVLVTCTELPGRAASPRRPGAEREAPPPPSPEPRPEAPSAIESRPQPRPEVHSQPRSPSPSPSQSDPPPGPEGRSQPHSQSHPDPSAPPGPPSQPESEASSRPQSPHASGAPAPVDSRPPRKIPSGAGPGHRSTSEPLQPRGSRTGRSMREESATFTLLTEEASKVDGLDSGSESGRSDIAEAFNDSIQVSGGARGPAPGNPGAANPKDPPPPSGGPQDSAT